MQLYVSCICQKVWLTEFELGLSDLSIVKFKQILVEIVQSEGFDKAACKLGLGGVVELRPDAIPGVTSDYEHETGPGFFTVVHTEPAFVFLIHCESTNLQLQSLA